MNKRYSIIIVLLFLLCAFNMHAATWERLYSMKSTDCFRNVKEVSSGGFIVAGYTSNFTSHDTDAIVLRLDDNGDTMWSYTYNGPNNKEDCFYKVLPTADGGFVLCGYSKSFGNGDNAFYLKLNSSGNMQWVKNWGGSGIERAQDIVQLSDGKYVICGYSTTSPARYYDAFILKIDASGNTLWSKLYGTTAYDDANSLKVLADDGFIMGGQSNNQLYLVRTDANGDSLWTKTWGTSGVDNIECVNFAQDGPGFIIAGTTDGPGAGGEDAYVVRTDTGGIQLWAKTIGGSLNDGFHTITPTSDGGYVGVGTSSEGPWPDPNIWIAKMDVSGNKTWENFFGGDNHDHGYGGMQTSDGGYIVVGHSHSFANNNNLEDAMVVKTNSSGNVTSKLNYVTISNLLAPSSGGCGSNNVQVQVEITNWSDQTLSSVPVTVEITGAINQTLTQTYSSSMTRDQVKTLTFTTTVDMSMGGTFNFHCFTTGQHDVLPAHNFFDKTITVGVTSAAPSVTNGTHCGPYTVSLSASSPDQIKWYSAASGGSSLFTGASFTTPFLSSTTTYYAQAGSSCPSSRVPVIATITSGNSSPTVTDNSRCGNGTVVLSASSGNTIKWYDASTSIPVLATGTSYTTPTLNASSTYYVSAESGSCTSPRVAVHAVINPIPAAPNTNDNSRCGSGTVTLTATATGTIKWYDAATGGSQVGTGTSYTTPSLTSSETYYALADDGTCQSNRIAADATINAIPTAPSTNSDSRCGTGTLTLTATASDPVKWYDAASGGTMVHAGSSFTTPSLSSSTTYYALADNGDCVSSRNPATATIVPAPADPVVTSDERCGDGTLNLSATSSNSLVWYSDAAGTTQVGSGSTYTTGILTTTTTFYVQAEDINCTSALVPVDAVVHSLPVVDLGPDVQSVTSNYLLDAGAGFNDYLWSTNDVTQTLNVTSTGTYCVTVTDANNCSATDCALVEFSVGVNEISGQAFELFPNPSNGKFLLTTKNNATISNVVITDIAGNIVFDNQYESSTEKSIDVSFLSSGVYMLRFSTDKEVRTAKIIIEK